MFCPQCRSEFREGFFRCPNCECELVGELPDLEDRSEKLRQLAASGGAVRIARASYREAAQMVETIQSHGVDAMLTGDCDAATGCCKRGCGGPQAYVTVLPEDVQDAAAILREVHRNLVADMEGGSLEALDAEVDLDSEGEKTCPACGAKFEGSPEECPDCGLYLGAG